MAKPHVTKPVKHLPKIVHVTIKMHGGNKSLTVYLEVTILSFSLDEENCTLLSSFAHKMLKLHVNLQIDINLTQECYKLRTGISFIPIHHAHSFVGLS